MYTVFAMLVYMQLLKEKPFLPKQWSMYLVIMVTVVNGGII